MNPILHPDFLLSTELARRLYHETAVDCAVVDFHCHLDAGDMASNRRFDNLAQLWVTSDPYKHRAMRILGVPEAEITGAADDWAKFRRWAETVPQLLGSPLHHWSVLELSRYFAVDTALNADSAEAIWNQINEQLAGEGYRYRDLLCRYPVETVCTSDRLLDSLDAHRALAAEGGVCRWLPSLRADDIVAVETDGFTAWLDALGAQTGQMIKDWDAFKAAVVTRLDAFDALGCRLSDHGLDVIDYVRTAPDRAAALFRQRLTGMLSANEARELRSALLLWLGGEYARRGWILQLHLGARRKTSARLRRLAGPAGGYAAIGNPVDLDALCEWLGDLETDGGLPRINLYSLNPNHFAAFAVLTGSFAEDGVAGKVQFGPAWWWNDQRHGMRNHLEHLAAHGVLSTFIGMTTDSRSVLSFVRHEYFRRILCEWLGEEITAGRIPDDPEALQSLVRKLCYTNAKTIIG